MIWCRIICVVFFIALFTRVQSRQFCVRFTTLKPVNDFWESSNFSCDKQTLAISDEKNEPHIGRTINIVAEFECEASTSQVQQEIYCNPFGRGSKLYFMSPSTSPPNDPRQFSYVFAKYNYNHTYSYAKTVIEDVYDPLKDIPTTIGLDWKIKYSALLTREIPDVPNTDRIIAQAVVFPNNNSIIPGVTPALPISAFDATHCYAGDGINYAMLSVNVQWTTSGVSCFWSGAAPASIEEC